MAESIEERRRKSRERVREARSTPEGRKAWNDRANERTREVRRRTRLLVLEYYGGRCACCDEDREPFLVVDHIDGGGNKHRKEIQKSGRGRGGGGPVTYKWLVANDFPPGFQVLCANCNMAKDRPEGCPHQRQEIPDP